MKEFEVKLLYKAVEDITSIKEIQIKSGKRNLEIMEAKSIMMYIMRRKALNLVEIAKHLNLKNHATVSVKCTQFSGWLEVRKELAIMYNMVQERYQFYLDTLPIKDESEIDILIKAQQEHHELMMYRLNKIKNG
jgi:chromosomal replication initiation ATPase DnaA